MRSAGDGQRDGGGHGRCSATELKGIRQNWIWKKVWRTKVSFLLVPVLQS